MIKFTNDIEFNSIKKNQIREIVELNASEEKILKSIDKIEIDGSINFENFHLFSKDEFNIIFYFKLKVNKVMSEVELTKVFRLCNKIVSKNKEYKILVEIENHSLLLLENADDIIISKPLNDRVQEELFFTKVSASYFEEVYQYYVQTVLLDSYSYRVSKEYVLQYHDLQKEITSLTKKKNDITIQSKKCQNVHEEEKLQKQRIILHKEVKELNEKIEHLEETGYHK